MGHVLDLCHEVAFGTCEEAAAVRVTGLSVAKVKGLKEAAKPPKARAKKASGK